MIKTTNPSYRGPRHTTLRTLMQSPSRPRRAFSLIEMMIAIVILGLGLTMVATMFPVAWDRARRLSEFTTEQAVTNGVLTIVESNLRPGGMRDAGEWIGNQCFPSDGKLRIGTSGLAGDLLFDPNICGTPGLLGSQLPQAILNDWQRNGLASDTRVHALHLENLLADTQNPPQPVAENPGAIELLSTPWLMGDYPDAEFPRSLACGFRESSFLTPRFPVNMRVFPPMEALPEVNQPGGPARRDLWLRRVERRRFAWAVLHRLRDYVGPTPEDFNRFATVVPADLNAIGTEIAAKAAAAWGAPRVFDMYLVTLRRPNPSNRYALQDPASAPDPNKLDGKFARIQALPVKDDVRFPVAWRVQIELPSALNDSANSTGIPTEVLVPPDGAPEQMIDMMVSMFPEGTRFVDEINGRIYRVVSSSLNGAGTQAILRLDREITLEDVELPAVLCQTCTPLVADPQELLRTVWVFPPPVDRSQRPSDGDVIFDGRTPVSNIAVRSVTLTPPPA